MITRMHFKSPAPGAFTLLEVLAVLAVVGLLAGLLLAAASRAGAKASGTICLANLRQLQVAWQLYVDDFRGERAAESRPTRRGTLAERTRFLDWLEQRPP
ncbi:MAG: prepilin-type N-terminal cleavage/methylation domain-containing protein [Verrucomicrobia bacterium]|nr:prepilin-type N-terminal cleavage/methylation domain-containing protein [Verrucomicrobiota bacterium]